MSKNKLIDIVNYIKGFADAQENEILKDGSDAIDLLIKSVCGQGYIGCKGGDKCSSDHK